MGREIETSEFSKQDFQEFKERLRDESRILMEWFNNGIFESAPSKCGIELEAWLVEKDFQPAPVNEPFLERVTSPLVVPELSKFNFEINSAPHGVEGSLLSVVEKELRAVWDRCAKRADEIGAKIVAIGILPTIREDMLTMDNMSSLRRYHALNKEVLRLREGKPLQLYIEGKDSLYSRHENVMLEAAATSLQIHIQVPPSEAVSYYNASQILSAPMVAVAANSPYLFGKDLWDETRIPTFEQAVAVASFRDHHGENIGRVTFGTGYARKSIMEPFLENLDGFPVLLPMVVDDDPAWLTHLRLHNGTIWRWNRPLIGIGEGCAPHIRIEHRVAAAGPSIPDMVANIAFFLGLIHHLVKIPEPLESLLPFKDARKNFYQAAEKGLNAKIKWLNGKEYPLRTLLLESLIPAAREALFNCGLFGADITHYVDEIMIPRIRTGRNGAFWQRSFIAANGQDFQKLTSAYYENQKKNSPVHEWPVEG